MAAKISPPRPRPRNAGVSHPRHGLCGCTHHQEPLALADAGRPGTATAVKIPASTAQARATAAMRAATRLTRTASQARQP